MFLGEYYLQFTAPGRIVLPHKFRGEIGGEKEIVLSRGYDGCIWGFDKKDWETEAKGWLEISNTDPKARGTRRYLFSAAELVALDEQGRFIIPKVLTAYSRLTEQVVMIGAGDHFEIWNAKAWKKTIKKLTKQTSYETSEFRGRKKS